MLCRLNYSSYLVSSLLFLFLLLPLHRTDAKPSIPDKWSLRINLGVVRHTKRVIRYRRYQGKPIFIGTFTGSFSEKRAWEGHWENDKAYMAARFQSYPLPTFDCEGHFAEDCDWKTIPGKTPWQIGQGNKCYSGGKKGARTLNLTQPHVWTLTTHHYFAATYKVKVWFHPTKKIVQSQLWIPGKPIRSYKWKEISKKPDKKRTQLVLEAFPSPLLLSSKERKKCRIVATVFDKTGKPKAGVFVSFNLIRRGKLLPQEATTAKDGKAHFIYTAPLSTKFKKWMKGTLSQEFIAKEGATGTKKTLRLPLTLPGSLKVLVKYPVMPSDGKTTNGIRLKLQGARGKTYKVKLRVASKFGRLGKGAGKRSIWAKINTKHPTDIPYHWTGSKKLSSAVAEKISVEIPKLKLKNGVKFSVGVDLHLISIERRSHGPIYPHIPEDMRIWIEDAFHPKGSGRWKDKILIRKSKGKQGYLQKLVKAFPKLRPTVTWITKREDPIDPGKFYGNMLKCLYRAISQSKGRSVLFNDVFSGSFKRYKGRWAVVHSSGSAKINKGASPHHIFFRRGTFEIEATLKPSPLDANLENQRASLGPLKVTKHQNFASEMMENVYLPCSEFIMLSLINLPGATKNLAVKAGFFGIDVAAQITDHLRSKKKITGKDLYLICANAFFTVTTSKAGIANPILENAANVGSQVGTLATLSATILDELAPKQQNQRRGSLFGPLLASPAYGAQVPSSDRGAQEVILHTIKAAKNYNIAFIELNGISSIKAFNNKGKRLVEKSLCPLTKNRHKTLLVKGKRFAVIPYQRDPLIDLRLNLSGTGTSGNLTIGTPSGLHTFAYPKKSWNTSIEIGMAGFPRLLKGTELKHEGTFTIDAGFEETIKPKAMLAEKFNSLDLKRWQQWAMVDGPHKGVSVTDDALILRHRGAKTCNARGIVLRKGEISPIKGSVQIISANVDRDDLGKNTEVLMALLPKSCVKEGKGILDPRSMTCPILHISVNGAHISVPHSSGALGKRNIVIKAPLKAVEEGCAMMIEFVKNNPKRVKLSLLADGLKILGSKTGHFGFSWKTGIRLYSCIWAQGTPEGKKVFARIHRFDTFAITAKQFRQLSKDN